VGQPLKYKVQNTAGDILRLNSGVIAEKASTLETWSFRQQGWNCEALKNS
jgi:hypothetical protein